MTTQRHVISSVDFYDQRPGYEYHVLIGTDPAETWFYYYAKSFLESSKSISQCPNGYCRRCEKFGTVPHYLALHSIEISLKGLLWLTDSSIYNTEKLKKFGHSLQKLNSELISHNLVLFTDDENKIFDEVKTTYQSKGFEYGDNLSDESPVVLHSLPLIQTMAETSLMHLNEKL